MLLAPSASRGCGFFRGDLFVAARGGAAAAGCWLLFIAFPVLKALAGAFFDEDGALRPGRAAPSASANERIWGLGCLAGGVRCGVAWNTLLPGAAHGGRHHLLGTLMALMAERGSRRWRKPLNVLALLPIITPPFVVGLGLILLFGRAGHRQPVARRRLRHHADALVLRRASASGWRRCSPSRRSPS